MWHFLSSLFDPFLYLAAELTGYVWEIVQEDNRPQARRFAARCGIVAAVLTMASVVAIYLATMR